jgi:hypothetical protein
VPSPIPSPELRARVLEATRREPVRSRAEGERRRAAVVALGFLVSCALGIVAGRLDRGERPLGYIAALVTAWLVLASAATWVSVGRGQSMLGRPVIWRIAAAVLTPVAMLATWLALALAWPETLHSVFGARPHTLCAVATVVFATGPLIAFAVVRRGTDPVTPRLTGAALGAAAGAWGAVGVQMFCSFTAPVHVLLGHLLPVALLPALGVLIGDRVVAIRARAPVAAP